MVGERPFVARLAIRFVELARPHTVPTFSISTRETAGQGRLPDLISLKDIQMGRRREASDPRRFNLFASTAAVCGNAGLVGWRVVLSGVVADSL